ncbi:MAG: IS66 family transposase, partial [Nitrososphaerota archaeon]|nr:IS66 family transposase [Nitrososphaerota archaeon]
GAKADSSSSSDRKKNNRPPGRQNGHEGKSRSKPTHIDERVELDESTCPKCGGHLSKDPTDEYTRVVEDIVPARVVVTEYVIKRRYCKRCGGQVSPRIPNVIGGGSNERFGLRLMLLMVSLKLLGLSYAKIRSLFALLFNLEMTETAIEHSVSKVAEAFGPQYSELISDVRKEKSVNGDETSWRIKGRNHWLWTFVGKWSVVYEIANSRGRDVPLNILGSDYQGTVISDSWPAWNYVGRKHQRCLQHYRRDVDDTLAYKSPGKEFLQFAKKFKRLLNDAIKIGRRTRVSKKDRLRAKKRFEKRLDKIIQEYSSVDERNCKRFLKRLTREKEMLFTFLEEKGVDWNNNRAERAIRPSVVIRKITYGNQSTNGADVHKVLMSISETCKLRGMNFYDYALNYLNSASES